MGLKIRHDIGPLIHIQPRQRMKYSGFWILSMIVGLAIGLDLGSRLILFYVVVNTFWAEISDGFLSFEKVSSLWLTF